MYIDTSVISLKITLIFRYATAVFKVIEFTTFSQNQPLAIYLYFSMPRAGGAACDGLSPNRIATPNPLIRIVPVYIRRCKAV
jgi:hypothetical protein